MFAAAARDDIIIFEYSKFIFAQAEAIIYLSRRRPAGDDIGRV